MNKKRTSSAHNYNVIQELEKDSQKFETLIQESSDVIQLLDKNGKVIYSSGSLKKVLGYKVDEVVGKNAISFIHSEDKEYFLNKFATLLQKPNSRETAEFRVKHKNGSWVWIDAIGVNHLKNPSINAIVGNFRDVTERKITEEAQFKLAAIIKSSEDAVISKNLDGIITSWNKAAERLFGYKAEEVIGKSITIILPIELRYEEKDIITKIKKGIRIKHYETVRVTKDGKKINVSLSISPIKDKEGKIIGAAKIARNITLQKKIEIQLKEQAALLQIANDSFIVLDKENTIQYWNQGAYRLYGYTEKEAIGQKAYKLLKTQYPTPVEKIFQELENHASWRGELLHTTKNSKQVIVDSRWELLENNSTYRVLEVNRDVTDRKNLERQKDDFVAIATHELKTPVTSAKAYNQILQNRFKKVGDLKSADLLAKMDSQLNRLIDLIADLLDVTKIESGKLNFNLEFFDLNNLVKDLIEDLQLTTQKHTLIIKGKITKKVFGDKDRAGQVLSNLITNAIKYSPYSDKIIISLSQNRNLAQISVQDFGVGISKEKQDYIFERFFRVSGPNEQTFPGLGLGLYISAEIVKRLGGQIWVKSIKGKGSTFFFTIPFTSGKAKKIPNNISEELKNGKDKFLQ